MTASFRGVPFLAAQQVNSLFHFDFRLGCFFIRLRVYFVPQSTLLALSGQDESVWIICHITRWWQGTALPYL